MDLDVLVLGDDRAATDLVIGAGGRDPRHARRVRRAAAKLRPGRGADREPGVHQPPVQGARRDPRHRRLSRRRRPPGSRRGRRPAAGGLVCKVTDCDGPSTHGRFSGGPGPGRSAVSLPSRRPSPLAAVLRAGGHRGGAARARDADRVPGPRRLQGRRAAGPAAGFPRLPPTTRRSRCRRPATATSFRSRSSARLVNTLVITPIRVIFLIVLIGTTLEVLTERTRASWRIARWRSKMAGHTVVVGYGTKGRSALKTLREAGVGDDVAGRRGLRRRTSSPRATGPGWPGVTGDATRRDVLASAQIEHGRADDHRRQPGRHRCAHRADRPPAEPRPDDHRRGPGGGERAAAAPERGRPRRSVVRRGRPPARPVHDRPARLAWS